MDVLNTLEKEFKLKPNHTANIIQLIDEGNTIPFIARYRKEMTGSVDDQILRELYERLIYLRNLNEKKNQVESAITEQGNMTEEILNNLNKAVTITEIEDIYRPFRPKKRTKAMIAKEKGLEPLANEILMQNIGRDIAEVAKVYINNEKGVATIEDAMNGAMDIIAEAISDNAAYRGYIRKITAFKGIFKIKAKDIDTESVYEMYYDFSEPVAEIAPHRVLAINRGEQEDFLSVKLEAPVEEILNTVHSQISKGNKFCDAFLTESLSDAYKRLIAPSVEREIRRDITEKSEDKAIKVFSENLKQLLLLPPLKDKTVLALDPGFRTGCKFSVIDETGKVLETGIVYPTPPLSRINEAKNILLPIISKTGVDVIAIGNGTASRETESFVSEMIKESDRKLAYAMVNEAGASVYSASKLGAAEFPGYDVALRSAVSIGRRLQDPLAELVKIDPRSIGVGQYQHDMNQKRLSEALGGVVEDCVNAVGVDLNTASPSLLSHISGVSDTLAKSIMEYREQNGKFTSRRELLKVKKLGPKAFMQCAGFLRINRDECEDLFDSTGVHPESYKAAEALLAVHGLKKIDIGTVKIKKLLSGAEELKKTAKELEIGIPTLSDIIKELEKPGRDPRDDIPPQILRSDILSIEDLQEGMIVSGTVRNVVDFGAFIDIGVHQDALCHISNISDRFIKHPLEAVRVGDIVSLKILNVDAAKKRISVTMRGI